MSTETPTAPSNPDHNDPLKEGGFFMPETTVLDRPETKNRRWIKPAAIGATLLAAGGLTWGALRGGGEEKPRTTPPVASGSLTPGVSPEATTAAPVVVTPEVTESAPLTASQRAESLSVKPDQYDQSVMEKLQANDSDIQRIKTHFADRYPDISLKLETVLTSHEEAFGQLTSDAIVGAQERFNKALSNTIYDSKSLDSDHPKLVSVGEYFSSGDYSSPSFTLPNGIMPPNLITDYAQKAKANHLPADQNIQSFLSQQLDNGASDWGMVSNVAQNEKHTTNFFSKLPADESQKFVSPTSSALDFLQAHYIYKQADGAMQSVVNNASDPDRAYAACGESFILKASHEDVTYGPTTIPVNGITIACEQPGAKQFVVESFVLLPVDSYYQGKKTNKPVLQPFILQADTFPGIK